MFPILCRRTLSFAGRAAAIQPLFAGLWTLTIMPASAEETTPHPPRVLMLYSNDRLLPANLRVDEGIRKALDPKGGQQSVSLFAEFLDAIRLGGLERESAAEDYLTRRYRETPPDVLVALGPQALDFLLARRQTLFPGKPLVFGGVGLEKSEEVQGSPGVCGLPMELTVKPIVKALLAMRPQTREILVVHGAADFDRRWRDVCLRQCRSLTDRVKVTDYPELPLAELKTRLAALPPETAVLYLTYFQSPTGETYTPARVAAELAAAAAVPVLGPYDTYIGSGVLGVAVSPFEEEGQAVGDLVRRVLSGEQPGSLGTLPSRPTRLIFDARQLKRWEIKDVPAGAEVQFSTHSVWEEHPATVVAALGVVVFQGLMISGLIIARVRRKKVEQALRLSEARFAGVFHGSPAAISIMRKSDGRLVDVNPGWEEATGMSREESIGKTPLEAGLIISGDAEGRFRMFLDSGKPLQDYEQLHCTPDGTTRVLSLSTELITLHDELCFVVVAKDVTEPLAEEKARQQLAQTSRLAMLGEMTASIAHEINQPLGAILSNTDAAKMLLNQASPQVEEVKQILADIRRDDLRASAVIKRVRALVGRHEIQQVPVRLNEVLLETYKLIKHDAQRRGVTLAHELAEDLPEIQADPVQVEQVVLNFLLNAMDAMAGTPLAHRRLVLRSSRKNEHYVDVSVEDRGHGVPTEKLGMVFDSFFTTKEGGMGLGLALARSIAEAHRGYLLAENNPVSGATFRLILPINPPSPHERGNT